MIKFIQLFENQFSEDSVLEGEAMLDGNSTLQMVSKKKNQWNYIVHSKKIAYKVELSRKSNNSLAYKCSCMLYRELKECSHIVFALFHLRKELLEIEQSTSETRIKHKRIPRIKDLLNDSSKEEIYNFIQGYTKKDQKFKLFLQTHLINNCEIENITPLVNSILSKLIKPKRRESDQISKSQYKFLIQLLNEIYTQAEDKIAIEQYAASFEIIQITIDKISYSISTYYYDNEILEILNQLHIQISQLLHSTIAPELRNSIMEFIISISQKSYYSYYNSYNIINTLEQYKIKDLPILQQLRDSIIDRLKKQSPNSTTYISNIVAYLRICALGKFKINPDIIDQLDHDQVYMAFIKMYKFEYYNAIIYNINNVQKKDTQIKSYTDLLINTYQRLNNKEKLNNLLFQSFNKFKDFTYFNKLKKGVSKSHWLSHSRQIKKILLDENDIKSLAKFYMEEDKTTPLTKLLLANPSWDLVQSYSSFLFRKEPLKLEQIYQAYINELMKTFFGTFASDKIKNLYRLISTNNNEKMLFKIKRFIIQTYPNRLIED